jgi:hypothetical protein
MHQAGVLSYVGYTQANTLYEQQIVAIGNSATPAQLQITVWQLQYWLDAHLDRSAIQTWYSDPTSRLAFKHVHVLSISHIDEILEIQIPDTSVWAMTCWSWRGKLWKRTTLSSVRNAALPPAITSDRFCERLWEVISLQRRFQTKRKA